jgi:predicted peptidase
MIATLVMASTLAVAASGKFEAHEHYYTGGQYKHQLFRYQLFVPDSLKPQMRYPLLVWLHGYGEGGSDNQRQLNYMDILIAQSPPDSKFFILVTQCPPDNRNWFRHRGGDDIEANRGDMVTITAEILRNASQQYPVDQNRVYLAGVSAGGSGCWEMAMRYPNLFAAVAPMASGGGDLSRVKNLIALPIWAFHNTGDKGTPPDGVKQTVAALEAAGGNVYLSLFEADGHDSWSRATKDCHVMDWMLAQRRNSVCLTPPNHPIRQWWHLIPLPCFFLMSTRLAWYLEQRRRRRLATQALETTEEDIFEDSLCPEPHFPERESTRRKNNASIAT